MNNRLKELRKSILNLSQENFGKRIGIGKTAVSKLELGENKLSESMIKLICKEFNVNPYWLKDGKGNMFNIKKESSLDLLCKDYGLDEVDKIVIQRYLQLSKDDRKSINNFILGISNR